MMAVRSAFLSFHVGAFRDVASVGVDRWELNRVLRMMVAQGARRSTLGSWVSWTLPSMTLMYALVES